MSLASNPTPKSREGSLLLPAVRLTVWRELGQVLQREHVMGYLLVLPAVLLLVGLVAYPFVIALWLSLTDAYVGRGGDFIGLRNFLTLFMEDDIFRQTLRNSILFTTSAVAIKTVLGLSLALLLAQNLRLKRLIRGAVLLPWVIPTALSTLG